MRAPGRHFATPYTDTRVHLPVVCVNSEYGLFWLANCEANRMKRKRNHSSHNGSDDLTYYMHDGATSFRFEIEGSLCGSAAMELEQSWRTASSVIGNRPL